MIAFQGGRMSSDHGRRAEFRGVPAPFVEAKNSHEHRGEDSLHVLGCMERKSTVLRAEFRGVPAPSVETENNHEHRGAPSVEATVPESAGGRTQ